MQDKELPSLVHPPEKYEMTVFGCVKIAAPMSNHNKALKKHFDKSSKKKVDNFYAGPIVSHSYDDRPHNLNCCLDFIPSSGVQLSSTVSYVNDESCFQIFVGYSFKSSRPRINRSGGQLSPLRYIKAFFSTVIPVVAPEQVVPESIPGKFGWKSVIGLQRIDGNTSDFVFDLNKPVGYLSLHPITSLT